MGKVIISRLLLQQTPPRTGGAITLTRLALWFWAPGYRKFFATTGAGLAPSPQALPSLPTSVPLVKLNMRYESVSHNKFSIGLPTGEWR